MHEQNLQCMAVLSTELNRVIHYFSVNTSRTVASLCPVVVQVILLNYEMTENYNYHTC